jgi:uncharacterized protein
MFMSCREDQDFATAVIDSLKFAADEACMVGKIAVSCLSRLDDVLVSREGALDCRLTGYRRRASDGSEMFGLHLQVSGHVALRCQRCLGAVDFLCEIDSHLMLMPADVPSAEWPEEELETDDYDAIPASREMALGALVEEEVLLALPIVPRHEECQLPVDTEAEEKVGKPSPFAVLAGLKKH